MQILVLVLESWVVVRSLARTPQALKDLGMLSGGDFWPCIALNRDPRTLPLWTKARMLVMTDRNNLWGHPFSLAFLRHSGVYELVSGSLNRSENPSKVFWKKKFCNINLPLFLWLNFSNLHQSSYDQKKSVTCRCCLYLNFSTNWK